MGAATVEIVVGTSSSALGAGRLDEISQQDERCGAALTLFPLAAVCIAAIIGQSGVHCVE